MILSAERTAPGIAPLESLGLPSLLDGSQGRNRGPEEKSALDVSNDLEAIHAWLASRASRRKPGAGSGGFLPRSGLERRAKDGIPPLGALSTARFPTQAGVRL